MKKLKCADGNWIQIITEAVYEGKKIVIYQQLFGDFQVLAVDQEKIDDVIGTAAPKIEKEEIAKTSKEEAPAEPMRSRKRNQNLMERFLDAESCQKKIEVLESAEEFIDDIMLDMMASAMDVVLMEESIDQKFFSLMKILRMRAKYETER